MSTNVIELPGGHDRESGVRQQVADNLTAELARKRISGRDAAKALGLTQMYVARRTSGAVELSVSDLVMFADFLNIDVHTLLQTENPHQAPSGGSSVGPAGIEPTTHGVEDRHFATITSLEAYRARRTA